MSANAEETTDRDRIVIRRATRGGKIGCGGILLFFGVALIGVGIAWVAGWRPGDAPLGAGIAWAIFGLLIALAGCGFLCGSVLLGVVINRREGTLTAQWGSAAKKTREVVYRFGDLARVTLTRKVHGSSSGPDTARYPVCVQPNGERDPIELADPLEYLEARAYAERIAKFCGLPVADTSSGEETVVRAAGELDESLRTRARRRGEPVQLPQAPAGLRSVVRVEGDTLTIDLPPYKMGIGCLAPLVLALLGATAMVAASARRVFPLWSSAASGEPRDVTLAVAGTLALAAPFLLILFMVILVRCRRQRIRVRAGELIHEAYRVLPRKVKVLPVDRIEEVVMESSRGLINPRSIVIRTDKDQIELRNMSMGEPEREYLRDVLRAFVSV